MSFLGGRKGPSNGIGEEEVIAGPKDTLNEVFDAMQVSQVMAREWIEEKFGCDCEDRQMEWKKSDHGLKTKQNWVPRHAFDQDYADLDPWLQDPKESRHWWRCEARKRDEDSKEIVECGFTNQFTSDACAQCGIFRFQRTKELASRVGALLQTCNLSETSIAQLIRRENWQTEGQKLGVGITSGELREEGDYQLSLQESNYETTRPIETCPLIEADEGTGEDQAFENLEDRATQAATDSLWSHQYNCLESQQGVLNMPETMYGQVGTEVTSNLNKELGPKLKEFLDINMRRKKGSASLGSKSHSEDTNNDQRESHGIPTKCGQKVVVRRGQIPAGTVFELLEPFNNSVTREPPRHTKEREEWKREEGKIRLKNANWYWFSRCSLTNQMDNSLLEQMRDALNIPQDFESRYLWNPFRKISLQHPHHQDNNAAESDSPDDKGEEVEEMEDKDEEMEDVESRIPAISAFKPIQRNPHDHSEQNSQIEAGLDTRPSPFKNIVLYQKLQPQPNLDERIALELWKFLPQGTASTLNDASYSSYPPELVHSTALRILEIQKNWTRQRDDASMRT